MGERYNTTGPCAICGGHVDAKTSNAQDERGLMHKDCYHRANAERRKSDHATG